MKERKEPNQSANKAVYVTWNEFEESYQARYENGVDVVGARSRIQSFEKMLVTVLEMGYRKDRVFFKDWVTVASKGY